MFSDENIHSQHDVDEILRRVRFLEVVALIPFSL
jgi:hypothetical protein